MERKGVIICRTRMLDKMGINLNMWSLCCHFYISF